MDCKQQWAKVNGKRRPENKKHKRENISHTNPVDKPQVARICDLWFQTQTQWAVVGATSTQNYYIQNRPKVNKLSAPRKFRYKRALLHHTNSTNRELNSRQMPTRKPHRLWEMTQPHIKCVDYRGKAARG
jgi:hypothetical protein